MAYAEFCVLSVCPSVRRSVGLVCFRWPHDEKLAFKILPSADPVVTIAVDICDALTGLCAHYGLQITKAPHHVLVAKTGQVKVIGHEERDIQRATPVAPSTRGELPMGEVKVGVEGGRRESQRFEGRIRRRLAARTSMSSRVVGSVHARLRGRVWIR